MPSIKNNQSGAVLIVCLMFLMVMSILGISSMNNATLEEKMAGHAHNKHLSFQAAETALRAGETTADSYDDATIFNNANGRYKASLSSHSNYPIWENVTDANWLTTSDITGMSQHPKYIIENYSSMPRDVDCGLSPSERALCFAPVYRITARGWGQNNNQISVLQSTYK